MKYVYHWIRAEYYTGFPLGMVFFVNMSIHHEDFKGDLLKGLGACLT